MAAKRHRRYPATASLLLIVWLPLNASAAPAPPLSPAQFRYSIYSDSTAELFWERTTNTSLRGYEISRNGEIQGVFDALSHLDSTLIPGTDYTFSITAVGTNGERSYAERHAGSTVSAGCRNRSFADPGPWLAPPVAGPAAKLRPDTRLSLIHPGHTLI